jgi:hypothetical protein
MKRVLRMLLFICAIALGSLIGNLLIGFELQNICLFVVTCMVLGYVFYTIDQKVLSKK